MRIIGLDPGYKKTGFGVIDKKAGKNVYIASGCIYSDRLNMLESCKNIFNDITILIKKYRPKVAVIENIFVYKNRNSVLKLAQTRGVIIAAIAAENIRLVEFSPKKIKKLILGSGNGEKDNIRKIIKQLLLINKIPSLDSADALAIAICYTVC